MNVHVRPPRTLTAAEESILADFERVVGSLPGNDAVTKVRRDAIAAFERDGLPNRKVEAWHYTDLRTALRELPVREDEVVSPDIAALLDDGAVIHGRSGEVEGTLPAGIEIRSAAARMRDGTLFASPGKAWDTIGQLNAAFANGGVTVDIAPDASVGKPVELRLLAAGGQSHLRNVVSVGSRSSSTLIERHTDGGADAALATIVTDVTVGEDAELLYVVVQERSEAGFDLGQINFGLGARSRLTLVMLQMGGKVARHEVNVDVLGEEADFQLRGVNLLGGDTLTDVTMVVSHLVPNTTSEEVFRNVGTGRARGVFQGQIRVAQVAQKTDAKMSCNTLLLSDDAEFAAKPELEIFADDVACGHGATVDDLEPEQLFYLMSRGIPEKEARALLVKGFVDEMLEAVEDEALSDVLEARIDRWLEEHA